MKKGIKEKMFTFIDENYRGSIYALKMYHSRKNMIIAGIVVFLIFTAVILLMLINKGWLMIISVPIALVITLIYVYFVNKDMKKKLLQTRVNVKKLTIKIDNDNIATETLFNNQNLVSSEIGLDSIIKVVETKAHYFLYNNPVSAIVLSKDGMIGNNEDAFKKFLNSKFTVKNYAK